MHEENHVSVWSEITNQWTAYLVNLDTGNDSLLDKDVNNLLAINSRLVEGLLKEDSTRDVVSQSWWSDKEGPVSLAVSLSVLKANRGESLATGGIRLIHGKDTPAWRCDGFLQQE